MFSTLLALALASGLLASPNETGSSHLAIVHKAIQYHGGSLYRASETSLEMCSKSGCFQLRAKVLGGEFDFSVTGLARGVERRVRMTNDRVWLWEDGVAKEIPATREQPLRDWAMARIYFPFLPFRLADPSVRHEDLGLQSWHGRPLHAVKVTFASGSSSDASDEYLYWFDPETGRLEQFAYSYKGSPGGLRFRRAVDYREVGGLLFFDQENLGVEGPGLAVDQIDPAFVAKHMRPVSKIELRRIKIDSITAQKP